MSRPAHCASRLVALLILTGSVGAQIVYEPAISSPAPNGPKGLVSGDLDGDGAPDLLLGHESGPPTLLLGLGDGSFGPEQALSITTAGEPLALADLDGDGNLDALIDAAGALEVWPGKGNGDFDLPSSFALGLSAGEKRATVGDIDQDLDTDVVLVDFGLAGSTPGAVIVLGNDGVGGLSTVATLAPGSPSSEAHLADFDEDGFVDVAVATGPFGGAGQSVRLWFGDAASSFAVTTEIVTASTSAKAGFDVEDLDNDGHVDWALTHAGDDVVHVNTGNGDGTFVLRGSYPLMGNKPHALFVEDLDDDEACELIVFNEDPGHVQVFLGLGDGTFDPILTVTASMTETILDPLLADFDADKRLDLATRLDLPGVDDQVDVFLNHTYAASAAIEDLGQALPGTHGYPIQLVEGTFVAGAPFSFTLHNGLSGSIVFHVVGLSETNAPFKGGIMVPSVDVLSGPYGADGVGGIELTGPWLPGVPNGTELWLQFWFSDPGGPLGMAASSAVKVTTP